MVWRVCKRAERSHCASVNTQLEGKERRDREAYTIETRGRPGEGLAKPLQGQNNINAR